MKRRQFLRASLYGSMTALAPLTWAPAREHGFPVRIGWLSAGTMEDFGPLVDAFRQGMSELGYAEGESYVIDFRWRADTPKTFDEMARDLMQSRPDLVLATCRFSSRAALDAAPDVPVVVAGGVDLVSVGLAQSLARPGGNVTGLTDLSPAVDTKRLELLKEAVPHAGRIAVLYQMDSAAGLRAMEKLKPAAELLGVVLLHHDANWKSDHGRLFDEIQSEKADAVLMVSGPRINFSDRRTLADLALQSRLPSSFPTYQFVEAGGMMSLGVDFRVLFRRSAKYVDKILKGANPGDLPIEQPTRFELAINQATARALGVNIPPSILVRADRIIE